jgi:hypothetical protein
MSEQRLNWLAPYGAGLLVGTALVVILPEGVAVRPRTRTCVCVRVCVCVCVCVCVLGVSV